MSVSSVSSSSSIWWEEYIEKQKKLQQQAAERAVASDASKINIEEILTELQALEDDPEKLKAKAAELAAQVTNEAQNVNGKGKDALKELASDLEAIAKDGDLSALEKKITAASPQRGSNTAGAKLVGPSGMSGGTGASIKWIEALVEEDSEEDDDEEEDDGLSLTETLEEYLEEYLEELEELKATHSL